MKYALVLVGLLFSSVSFAAASNFKMYSAPNANVNTFCDMHTALSMDFLGPKLVVDLIDRLSGACQIFVEPNPRTYSAKFVKDDCGTQVYEARLNETGPVIFTLRDNRTRTCQDLIPALIEVKEIDSNKTESLLYSKDR